MVSCTLISRKLSHRLLDLETLSLFGLLNVTCQEHRREHYESYTGANSACVVGPSCAEETGVSIVTWWNNRNYR